jgi:hypothetical protein
MLERSRTKQTISFKDRLASFAKEARKKASLLPAGIENDDLLRKASQAEATFDWANSPGLQPPK